MVSFSSVSRAFPKNRFDTDEACPRARGGLYGRPRRVASGIFVAIGIFRRNAEIVAAADSDEPQPETM